MQGLFGAGWFSGKATGRPTAGYVERSGFWSGAEPSEETVSEGLVAGTLVATEMGWQRVETLRPGDRVVTFDNGLQPLRGLGRGRLVSRGRGLPRGAQPLSVPARALGNRREMVLLPGQTVLIESDAAEARYGDPFTLVPAAALEGHRGIARTQVAAETEVVWLDFDGDEIVYAEGMVLAHCPRRQTVLVATVDELIEAGRRSAYRLLPPLQGRALVAELAAA